MKKITIFYDADYATMKGGGQKRLFEISKAANTDKKIKLIGYLLNFGIQEAHLKKMGSHIKELFQNQIFITKW